MNKSEMQSQALIRATQNQSFLNYHPIMAGFIQKGLAPEDIRPRENVFTFNAWRALGRTVKRGEHGVKITTWIEATDKKTGEPYKRATYTTVFHISQTEPLKGKE
jgi:hypothetical protein